jgi:hypothetical protein
MKSRSYVAAFSAFRTRTAVYQLGRNSIGVDVTGAMAGEIDINTVAKAYARWAPVYDFVFGAVFDAGRKASIAAAERIGGRILDVGIGTGFADRLCA